MRPRTSARAFIALWYLLAWLPHICLALFIPSAYQLFGNTALLPWVKTLWPTLVMPNLTALAFALAGFEILVGVCLCGRGRWVKAGLSLSLLFCLFLVQLGLGNPARSPMDDFFANRLPYLVFAGLHLPLFAGREDRTLPYLLGEWWRGIWPPAKP